MIYNYLNHVFSNGDSISLNTQMGNKVQFVVTNTKPTKPVIVTENTIFKLGSLTKTVDSSVPRITYDELGGLKNEVQKIREMVELPMRHPELFDKIGVELQKVFYFMVLQELVRLYLQKQLLVKQMLISFLLAVLK